MSDSVNPSTAATLLGCSISTVRRLSDSFTEHLPDYQTPEPRQPRQYTDADLRTLWAIMRQLEEMPTGAPRSALREELDNGTVSLTIPATLPSIETEAEEEKPLEPHETAQEAPQLPALPASVVTSIESLSALPEALERLTTTLKTIDARQQRERHPVTYAVIGAAAATVVVLLAVAIALALGLIG